MKPWHWALIMAISLSATQAGCASMYLGETVASFETPGGFKGNYRSHKNQQDFSAIATIGDDGKIRTIEIKTTATTPEAAMAAALQAQTEGMKVLGGVISKGAAFATIP